MKRALTPVLRAGTVLQQVRQVVVPQRHLLRAEVRSAGRRVQGRGEAQEPPVVVRKALPLHSPVLQQRVRVTAKSIINEIHFGNRSSKQDIGGRDSSQRREFRNDQSGRPRCSNLSPHKTITKSEHIRRQLTNFRLVWNKAPSETGGWGNLQVLGNLRETSFQRRERHRELFAGTCTHLARQGHASFNLSRVVAKTFLACVALSANSRFKCIIHRIISLWHKSLAFVIVRSNVSYLHKQMGNSVTQSITFMAACDLAYLMGERKETSRAVRTSRFWSFRTRA